jgi:hypothetical protein
VFRRPKIDIVPPPPKVADPEADVDWNQVPESLRGLLNSSLDAHDRWRRLVDRRPAGDLRTALELRTAEIADLARGIHRHAVRLGIEAGPDGLDPVQVERLTAVGAGLVAAVGDASTIVIETGTAPADLAGILAEIAVASAGIALPDAT